MMCWLFGQTGAGNYRVRARRSLGRFLDQILIPSEWALYCTYPLKELVIQVGQEGAVKGRGEGGEGGKGFSGSRHVLALDRFAKFLLQNQTLGDCFMILV
jgi:hypothetical protein